MNKNVNIVNKKIYPFKILDLVVFEFHYWDSVKQIIIYIYIYIKY